MSQIDRLDSDARGFENPLPASKLSGAQPGALGRPLALRLAFLAACAFAACAVAFLAGGGRESADPDLDKLLKAMAIIKTVILVFAGAAIWWRLGSAIAPALAAGYIVFTAAAAAGAALVWNNAFLGLAPFLFDGGLLAFLILTLRDDNGPWLRAFRGSKR